MSTLVAKFVYFNLAAKFGDGNLLNSFEVIYLTLWSWSVIFYSISQFQLWNWVFDNFILAEELFAKALQSLETFVLVNNIICGKLVSSLESLTTLDESFKVTLVTYFHSKF